MKSIIIYKGSMLYKIMKNDVNPYIHIKLSGIHDNCWSNNYEVKTKVFYYQLVWPYMRVNMIVPGNKRRIVIEEYKKFHKTFIINSMQKYRKSYLISVTKDIKETSILNLLGNRGAIFISEETWNGMEHWDFAVPVKLKNDIIKDLSNLIKIKEIKTNAFEPYYFMDLTPLQIRILETAINLGYYDYPKKTSLKDIAQNLGISKSVVLYNLRSINKKLGTGFLRFRTYRE